MMSLDIDIFTNAWRTDDHLSVREAAHVCGVSPRTIRRAIFEGSLPAVRIREGGVLRIPRSAVVWDSHAARRDEKERP